jgi:S-adenosylmethionine:tRNA ribosyltransferase-isomerase
LVDRGDRIEDLTVARLPELVGSGDLVVLNETKVIPARLRLRKETGGRAEVLLLEALGGGAWSALARPSRRLAVGSVLRGEKRDTTAAGRPGEEQGVVVVVGEALDGGRRQVKVSVDGRPVDDATAAMGLLGDIGDLPLPPYISAPPADPGRYQTVFAARPGSVAAPTAGLHLTPGVLDAIEAAGAKLARVDLVVGLDTFRPVLVDDPADHVMHTERYRVPADTWDLVGQAGRVVAVGTTTVRALESVAARGELEGRTDLFIRHPYAFEAVDAMLTNFHLPRSTLLLMIDAFIGSRWRELYRHALLCGYRFLSFGDAMFVESPTRRAGLKAPDR